MYSVAELRARHGDTEMRGQHPGEGSALVENPSLSPKVRRPRTSMESPVGPKLWRSLHPLKERRRSRSRNPDQDLKGG